MSQTKIEGLEAEQRHLQVQLKETQEFRELFEADNERIREEYQGLLERYNQVNQELQGFQSVLQTYREKTEKQREDIERLTEAENTL